jgi:hypothetical protein
VLCSTRSHPSPVGGPAGIPRDPRLAALPALPISDDCGARIDSARAGLRGLALGLSSPTFSTTFWRSRKLPTAEGGWILMVRSV